jgi:hypothetical protein
VNCISDYGEIIEETLNSHNKNTSNILIEVDNYNSKLEDLLKKYLKLKLLKEDENKPLTIVDEDQYDDNYDEINDDSGDIKKRTWRSWVKSSKRHHAALFKNSKNNGKRYNSNYNYLGRNMYYSGLQGNSI